MLILTASNKDFREMGDLNEVSLQRYCKAHPHHSYIRWEIPMAYAMPPSWFKLDMILCHLELGNPFVMWADADTLWVGDRDIPLLEHCDLQICRDRNGINCGVMVWRHSNLVMDFLRRINAMTEYFGHPWWEQKAIMDHLSELTVGYMEKDVWNAYPVPVPCPDAKVGSQILHFPAVKKRLEVMESYVRFPDLLAKQDSVNAKWLEMGPGAEVKIIFHPFVVESFTPEYTEQVMKNLETIELDTWEDEKRTPIEFIAPMISNKIVSLAPSEAVDASEPLSAVITPDEPFDASGDVSVQSSPISEPVCP